MLEGAVKLCLVHEAARDQEGAQLEAAGGALRAPADEVVQLVAKLFR